VCVSGGSGPRPAVMYSVLHPTPLDGATAIRLCSLRRRRNDRGHELGHEAQPSPPPRHHTFSGRGVLLFGGVQLRGPSRVAGFSLVGFGAKVASGSSDSTMAISSPGSRSEARTGRR
jgi:hypothetical protein